MKTITIIILALFLSGCDFGRSCNVSRQTILNPETAHKVPETGHTWLLLVAGVLALAGARKAFK